MILIRYQRSRTRTLFGLVSVPALWSLFQNLCSNWVLTSWRQWATHISFAALHAMFRDVSLRLWFLCQTLLTSQPAQVASSHVLRLSAFSYLSAWHHWPFLLLRELEQDRLASVPAPFGSLVVSSSIQKRYGPIHFYFACSLWSLLPSVF